MYAGRAKVLIAGIVAAAAAAAAARCGILCQSPNCDVDIIAKLLTSDTVNIFCSCCLCVIWFSLSSAADPDICLQRKSNGRAPVKFRAKTSKVRSFCWPSKVFLAFKLALKFVCHLCITKSTRPPNAEPVVFRFRLIIETPVPSSKSVNQLVAVLWRFLLLVPYFALGP